MRRPGPFVAGAAALLILAAAAVVLLTRPPEEPRTTQTPAGPPVAELKVVAANFECCGGAGGLEYDVALEGPGGPWNGAMAHAALGSVTPVIPRLPNMLAEGLYSLKTEVRAFGDAIPAGEAEPPDYGVVGACASEFLVAPETRVVRTTLSYWFDRCAAGTITAADPAELAAFNLDPTMVGECGVGGSGCDYRLALTGPGGTWATVIRSVKPREQLVGGNLLPALSPGAYRLEATSIRMSLEPEPGVGHQSELELAATCTADFVVTDASTSVDVAVRFTGETCTVAPEVRD